MRAAAPSPFSFFNSRSERLDDENKDVVDRQSTRESRENDRERDVCICISMYSMR